MEVQGTITKKLLSPKNKDWFGFKVGDTDRVYSTFCNEKDPPEKKETLKELAEGDGIKIFYTINKATDKTTGEEKTYFNIDGLERIIAEESPTNGDPSPTLSSSRLLSDMMLCNVTNNGTLIYCELLKKADLAIEVTHEVLEKLCDTLYDWHTKHIG